MKIEKEIIRSKQNPLIKLVASLADKKGREENRLFAAEGEKLTKEAAEAGLPLFRVIVSESRQERILPMLEENFSAPCYRDLPVTLVSDEAFSKISTENAPQGVISVIKYLDFFEKVDIIYKEGFFLREGERALILSSVRDPGNLGAVIRSANAFGVTHLILSSDCADIYSPKTIRSAMGGLFRLRVSIASDLARLVSDLCSSGRRVYAAELTERAVSVRSAGITPADVLIIGNEGHGIDPAVSAAATGSVYIPISSTTESLNAAVAASILLWEQANPV